MKTSNSLIAAFSLSSKKAKSLSLLASAAVAFPVISNAATQTIPFSLTPSGSVVLTFDREDIAVEDITSITVSVTMATADGTIAGDNDSSENFGSYDAEFGATASLSHSGGVFALAKTGGASAVGSSLSATDIQSGTLAVDDGDTIESGGSGSTDGFDEGGPDYFFFAIDSVGDSDSGLIDSNQWSNYVGSGTYTITINATQFQSITGVGGVATLTTPTTLSGEVSVTVVPVPEPSTYAALFGLAAVALVFFRRRK